MKTISASNQNVDLNNDNKVLKDHLFKLISNLQLQQVIEELRPFFLE